MGNRERGSERAGERGSERKEGLLLVSRSPALSLSRSLAPHFGGYANLGFALSGSISRSRIAWFTTSVLIFRSRARANRAAPSHNPSPRRRRRRRRPNTG